MKINISDKLINKFPSLDQAKIVLDFDHELSREAVAMDCCGTTRYRFVIVNDLPDIFDGEISSNLGPVYVKEWGKIYLDENMTLRPTDSGLSEFVSDAGVIAKNVEIVDYRA